MEMIDEGTVLVTFPAGVIIENLQLVIEQPGDGPSAALEPSIHQESRGRHWVVFDLPVSLQQQWQFVELVFDQALLSRRVLRSWSLRHIFHCENGICSDSDEVAWGLANGHVQQVSESNGRILLDTEMRRVP